MEKHKRKLKNQFKIVRIAIFASYPILFLILFYQFGLNNNFNFNDFLVLPFSIVLSLETCFIFFLSKNRVRFAKKMNQMPRSAPQIEFDESKEDIRLRLTTVYTICWALGQSSWILIFVTCFLQKTSLPFLYLALPFFLTYLVLLNFNLDQDVEDYQSSLNNS